MSKSPFEVPGEMRDLASRSVEQARRAFETFIGAAQKASDSVSMDNHPLRNMAEVSKMTVAYAERNMNAAFDMAEKLVQARTVEEAVRIQTEFMQAQAKTLRDQMTEAGQTMKLQFEQASAQVREQVDAAVQEGAAAQKTMQKAVDDMNTAAKPVPAKPVKPRATKKTD